MAGVVAARGSQQAVSAAMAKATGRSAAAAAPAASCREPDCNMGYHGGPVQYHPHVYLMFWGPQWNNTNNKAAQNARWFVTNFYRGLGKSPDVWSQTVSQYRDKGGQPVFGTSLLAGVHVDTSKPQSSVTPTNLGNEAAKAAGVFKIKDARDAEVVILTQSGTCFHPEQGITFAGNCGKAQTSVPGYCGYHNYDVNSKGQFLPWINLPFQPDAKDLCGQGFVRSPGVNDGFSLTGGHETTETITDPRENAWYDANDGVSGGEVADKCAWGGVLWGDNDPRGMVKLATGTWPMQSLWSNVVGPHCVMTGKLLLKVTTPATQHTRLGAAVFGMYIHATISGRTPLRYGESGLPKGLSINHSTGKIGGKATARGTFHVKVTVSYYAGSATVRFTWIVS